MSMTGSSVILEAGDYLFVPQGATHSTEVIGDEPAINIDASKH